jgi:hypothetical protein
MSQPAPSRGQLVPVKQQLDAFRLLADPSLEILMQERPRFSQLAPVPLRQVGTDTMAAGES